jgi:hypothetical protein
MMNILSHGVIHGNIIELQNNPGFQEGQKVDVILKAVFPQQDSGKEPRHPPGSRTLNWTEQDDRILAELYRQRRADTGREIPE